ncbi:MAG TPA: MAPEG family protein [Alphaproteobacteria bacterium]|nr:MAPEG family protein [Alphaproteobacteria bacterium]
MNYTPTVTILYAGIFGLLLMVLSLNVFREWVHVAISGRDMGEERWKRSERVQRNFIEFVPMCLLLLLLIELHGAPRSILHGLGGALVGARILHAYGLGNGKMANVVRVIGTQLTFLVLMICSLAAVYYALVPMIVAKAA